MLPEHRASIVTDAAVLPGEYVEKIRTRAG